MNRKTIFLILGLLVVAIIALAATSIMVGDTEEESFDSSNEVTDRGQVGPPRIVEEPKIEKGKEAPDFVLKDLDGNDISLSDFRGKVVLLNFWASWCVYCDQEMPDLERLYTTFDDIVVIGVNVGEDLDLVREYVEENNLTFPVALDSEADIASEYLVSGLPTTYFIDEDGIIYGRYPGMMTYNMMLEFSNETRKY